MNTEILIIFEQANGNYRSNYKNITDKSLFYFEELAIADGFGGGIEIIKKK